MANERAVMGVRQLRAAMRRLDPMVVFLAAGACLFVLSSLSTTPVPTVSYTDETETALIENFEALTGRTATPGDRRRLRREFLTDELLFQEAVARGLYLTDAQVKGRLVERAKLALVGVPADPSVADVAEFYADNLALYEEEARVSFDQVYFVDAPAAPDVMLSRVASAEVVQGDPLWTGAAYPDYGHSMLRGLFGQAFLDKVRSLPVGTWTGPIRSTQGWHYVRVTGRSEATLAPFGLVRDQVSQDLVRARTEDALSTTLAELSLRYGVLVDG